MNRIIEIAISLWIGTMCLQAQEKQFQSNTLAQLAKEIQFVPNSEFTHDSYVDAGVFNGFPIVAKVRADGVVSHIGFRLFTEEMMSKYEVVLEFLERYLLELICCKSQTERQQKLDDDKVLFLKGDLQSLCHLFKQVNFKLTQIDNQAYEAHWLQEGKEIMAMMFPAQYGLLRGMDLIELQKTLIEKIKNTPNDYASSKYKSITSYEPVGDGIYRSIPNSFYQIPDLNNTTYYRRNDQGIYQPIFDEQYLKYTAANICLLPNIGYNYELIIEQTLYGFKSITYNCLLSEWITYCMANDLQLYFAIENETDDNFQALVIAENKEFRYNHLLSILIPKAFISSKATKLHAKINAFIPTHNISNLYQEYKDKPKKNIL